MIFAYLSWKVAMRREFLGPSSPMGSSSPSASSPARCCSCATRGGSAVGRPDLISPSLDRRTIGLIVFVLALISVALVPARARGGIPVHGGRGTCAGAL